MNAPQQGRNTLPLKLMVILIVIIGLGAVLYLPKLLEETPPQSRSLLAAPGCDLSNSSCVASADQSRISLTINSPEIRSATPLKFEVQLQGLDADQVMLDLKGRDMYMGLNQVMMTPVADKPGLWQADATLAVCTTGTMVWVASIVTEKSAQITQADFQFSAQ